MNSIQRSRLLPITGLLLGVLVWLANNANPPTGRTGAPFDGHCNNCHGGSNPGGFDGTLEVSGLPATIESNTTYPLTLTMTPTAGSPTRGGFQLVVVNGSNANAGNLASVNAQTGTEFLNGREYVEHRNGKIFNGNPVSWDFNWTSPFTAAGNTIKLYFIGNFTNGGGTDSGDFPIAFSETFPFSGPPPVTATITNTTNVLCFGGNTGSATVEGDGGAPPYTYLWSNNQTGQTAVNLIAGTYTVTVTGSSGTGTATATATITQPPVLNASASAAGTLTCINTSVNVTATASGGTPSYQFNWSNGNSGNPTTYDTPGSQSVTVTDNNGCTKIATFNITANTTAPTANAGPSGTLTCTQTQTTLNGAGSSVGANIAYLWTASNGGNIVSGATTLNPIVNAAGTYTLLVTNNTNGCTSTAATTVTSNTAPPTANAGPPGVLTCIQTQTTLNGAGSSTGGNFTYLWTASNGGNITSGNTTLTPTVNAVGTYTILVTNTSNGCTSTASTTVTSNANPPNASATGGTLTCSATSIVINANSSTSGVTYAWTGPGGFMSNLQNPTVNLAGNYVVTVTNPANSCTATATATVGQNTTQPTAEATVNGQLTCTTTSAQLNITTNASSPSFAWTGPNNFNSNQQNPSVSLPGNYIGTVTNPANGCSKSDTVTVIQNIAPPGAAATANGQITCTNLSVQLNGSSPASPVTFAWTGPNNFSSNQQNPSVTVVGTYNLTVTSGANGCTSTASATVAQNTVPPAASIASPPNLNCNASTVQLNGTASSQGANFVYLWTTTNGNITSGSTTLTPIVSAAGVYNLLVTNTTNGCTATASTTVIQTPPVTAGASATNVSCNGGTNGTATVAPGGGAGNFMYAWSNSGTTATISNLPAGVYTVTVTDAENCTATATATVAQPAVLLANASATGETANGANNGTATAAPSGGTASYTYLWSNNATTATIINLTPGNYTVTVTDANACTAVQTVTVNSFNCNLTASISSTNATCNGANNGTAAVNLTGAASPVTYTWSNNATTPTVSNLAPGSYSVSILDANGCPAVLTTSITEPPVLSSNATATNETAQGANNGTATAQPTGGTSPYTYLWSNNATTATITNLAPGNYSVTVTDANACTATQTVTVNSFNCSATASITSVNAACPESADGQATVTLNGGTLPFTYLWSNNANTATITNLAVGPYSVTVTDADGCTATQSVTIGSMDTQAPTISCPGAINLCGADIVTYPAPVIADNCSLTGIQPVLVSGLPSGSPFNDGVTTQVFRVTDASGNTATCSFNVTVFPLPDILLGVVVNDSSGIGVGSIDITPVGGSSPYVFIWRKDGLFYSNEEDLDSLNAGVYSLMVIDANGCSVLLAPVTVSNTVGTDDVWLTVRVRLWPNPARTSFQLETGGVQVISGQIFTPQGQVAQEIEPSDLAGEISVAHLPAGMYYLKLTAQNGSSKMLKWVKTD